MMVAQLLSAIKNHFWKFLSVVLFAIILIQRGCEPKATITKLDIKPIVYPIREYVPTPLIVPHYIDTGSTKWLIKYEEQKLDTAKIMQLYREYYSFKLYLDTVHNDTNGTVIIYDSISENTIMKRRVEATFFPSIYMIPYTPVRKFYVGLGMGGYTDKFGMSGKVLFIDRKDRIYSLCYNPIIKYMEVSTFWKISFKK